MRILPCLLAALLVTGCRKPAMPVHASPVKFLALGDSYTIGESVDEPDRWPNQLARALRATGIDVADPQIIATTGWTTDELSAGMDRAKPEGPYRLVTLLIGVNNQYRGRPVDEYRKQFVQLLERAIKLAADKPSRVIVVSIPDYGVTPFAANGDRPKIARELDAFNAAAADEVRKRGAAFVDITLASRAAATDRSLVADDGLHPSAKMYAQWSAAALPVAQKALRDD
jgi:lysophospholipase L1-like esterase